MSLLDCCLIAAIAAAIAAVAVGGDLPTPPPRFNRIVFPMAPTLDEIAYADDEDAPVKDRAVQSPSASSGTHSPQTISKSLPEAISAQALADSYSSRLFPQPSIDESSSSPSSSSQYSSVYSTAADVFRMIASPMTSSPREPARTRSPSPFHVHRQLRPHPVDQQLPPIETRIPPEYPPIAIPEYPAIIPPEPETPKYPVVEPPDFSQRPRPPPPPSPSTASRGGPQPDSNKAYYAINFCDRGEFPDDKLTSTYGLERIDYFIWNASCSDAFFQCSIGQTFQLKCPGQSQAFDKETVNCNFRNSVKVCPEYDHVMHCTIAESCTLNEFACCAHPQQCLAMQKRCDGHNDCSDGEDENNCPSCRTDEFACVKSGLCIPAAKRCDGQADDCGDGTNLDEIGCSKNSTCLGKFICGHGATRSFDGFGIPCIDYTKHCDGVKDCLGGEDEVNCKPSEETKYLLCENQKQSVTKRQWCDGTGDCADASDEKYCY